MVVTITEPPFCNLSLLMFSRSFLVPLSLRNRRDSREFTLSLCLCFYLGTFPPIFVAIASRRFGRTFLQFAELPNSNPDRSVNRSSHQRSFDNAHESLSTTLTNPFQHNQQCKHLVIVLVIRGMITSIYWYRMYGIGINMTCVLLYELWGLSGLKRNKGVIWQLKRRIKVTSISQ